MLIMLFFPIIFVFIFIVIIHATLYWCLFVLFFFVSLKMAQRFAKA